MPCALANGLCGRQASFSDETPFIGRITDLWEDEHEKRMMVQWFYRSVRPIASSIAWTKRLCRRF